MASAGAMLDLLEDVHAAGRVRTVPSRVQRPEHDHPDRSHRQARPRADPKVQLGSRPPYWAVLALAGWVDANRSWFRGRLLRHGITLRQLKIGELVDLAYVEMVEDIATGFTATHQVREHLNTFFAGPDPFQRTGAPVDREAWLRGGDAAVKQAAMLKLAKGRA